MMKNEFNKSVERVCDLQYLNEMMGGKNHLIRGIIDAFLQQIPEELRSINEAIEKTNYAVVKSFAHTMKSSVSIMGITILTPVLHEMENLAAKATDIEKIKDLYQQLTLICKKAIKEIENEKQTYI